MKRHPAHLTLSDAARGIKKAGVKRCASANGQLQILSGMRNLAASIWSRRNGPIRAQRTVLSINIDPIPDEIFQVPSWKEQTSRQLSSFWPADSQVTYLRSRGAHR